MTLFAKLASRFRLNRALAAEGRGDFAGALALYREIVAGFDPLTRGQILNRMGMLAYALKDLRAARTYYEQALALAPGEASVLMNLANALHGLDEAAAAEEAYGRALAASGERADVLYNYAVFLAERDPRRAAGLVRRCLDAPVADLEALTLPLELPLAFLGALSARHGLVEETARYFGELERRPLARLKPFIMNEHALMLTRAGRHEEAAALYRRILDAWPATVEVRFNLGMALVRMNRLDEALADFRAADLPASHYGTGYIHELKGEIADAVREYRLCLAAPPARPYPADSPQVDFTAPFAEHAREFVRRQGS